PDDGPTSPAGKRAYYSPSMRRFAIPAVALVVAVALLALLAFGVAHQGTSLSIDASVARGQFPMAPDAHTKLPLLGAPGTTSLANMRGKIVVLNVFASWCQPCVAEAPILEQEQRQLVKNNATVLGVTYLDNSSDSEQFVQQHGVTYPVIRDVSGNFVKSFGTDGVPETFVINRRGRIVALRRYQLAGNWLQQTVSRILTQPA
ncbi:MAG TPA: TlpA disulfide reductase family protein, partial [Solirubrobacteraceae bacterium]|nr:TlpA disulfide reductase family protein [Solirubrobacteraceae bacterium]